MSAPICTWPSCKCTARNQCAGLGGRAAPTDARVKALEAENARLREALTPSGDTKAAYIGEFSMTIPITDEDGDELSMRADIPWTTIKEIMAAIRARAALRDMEGGEDNG